MVGKFTLVDAPFGCTLLKIWCWHNTFRGVNMPFKYVHMCTKFDKFYEPVCVTSHHVHAKQMYAACVQMSLVH